MYLDPQGFEEQGFWDVVNPFSWWYGDPSKHAELDRQIRDRAFRDAQRDIATRAGFAQGMQRLRDVRDQQCQTAIGDASGLAEAGIEFNAMALGGGFLRGGGGINHHIATNKNYVSGLRGGPWSPRFEELFERGGLSLGDELNKVRLPEHFGPHPEAYHREIFDRLTDATKGLPNDAVGDALRNELRKLGQECATPGTDLNRMLTK